MRDPASEKLEIIRLVEQSTCRYGARWRRSAFRAPPSTAGTTGPYQAEGPEALTDRIPKPDSASGTAFQTMFASGSPSWRWMSRRCR